VFQSTQHPKKQDRKCTYNVTWKRIRVTVADTEIKEYYTF